MATSTATLRRSPDGCSHIRSTGDTHSPEKAGTVSGFRRVTLVDVGAADLENVAVTEWQLPAGAQPMASGVLCTAVIQNYGRQARPLSVEFVVDGALHHSQTVTVTPGIPFPVFAVTVRQCHRATPPSGVWIGGLMSLVKAAFLIWFSRHV